MQATARRIFYDHGAAFPDLSHITVLLANPLAVKPFRRNLVLTLEGTEYNALLGPEVTTLEQWLQSYHTADNKKKPTHEQRLLMLAHLLKEHPGLYGGGDPWHLSEELLGLFDELSENSAPLPQSEHAFIQSLSKAYGRGIANNHTALLKEARLVYLLWQAWLTYIDASGYQDTSKTNAEKLAASLKNTSLNERFFYMLGFHNPSPALASWVDCLIARGQMCVLSIPATGLFHNYTNEAELPAHGIFYNTCFAYENKTLQERATFLRKKIPKSPVSNRIFPITVGDSEQLAKAVVLAVKQALLLDQKSIAIITEDRRLGRRVRALLERESIIVNDNAGWALSTTSASTIIENWLRCIEENFPHQALLDFLKSPFLSLTESHEEQQILAYRLEQDIILHENIASGIDRYRSALQRRAARLALQDTVITTSLLQLINSLSDNARTFSAFLGNKLFPAETLIITLIHSLDSLGIMQKLQEDLAGKLVAEALVSMHEAASSDSDIRITWLDFRIWLGRMLESRFFIPPAPVYDVELLNLNQSHLLSFDTVILAAADERHLPGESRQASFFNDAVRASLNLQIWEHVHGQRASLFRMLLEYSHTLKILWQTEENNEPLMPSPWVAAIECFHKAAYGETLRDSVLNETLMNMNDTLYPNAEPPLTIPIRPAPPCPSALLSPDITVSGYQRLMRCPYQFYVSDLLKLKPADEIREILQKADYGSRIHLCLQAFHSDVPHLPGPYALPLTEDNRNTACKMMEKISQQVFSRDMEDNFQHRSWFKRWLNIIPHYIDWEIHRYPRWHFMHAEKQAEVTFNAIKLHGRIDRVDSDGSAFALIDYKTGAVKKYEDILAGEDVQLSSYALMLDNIECIEYVGLGKPTAIDNSTIITGKELSALRSALQVRTTLMMQMLTEGHPLPAWADEESCTQCNYAGLCRRHAWQ